MVDNPATTQQEQPRGIGTEIAALVQKDIQFRVEIGIQKYGETLKAFNGRRALVDAYQEVLDLAMYLRQKIEEEDQSAMINNPCLLKK